MADLTEVRPALSTLHSVRLLNSADLKDSQATALAGVANIAILSMCKLFNKMVSYHVLVTKRAQESFLGLLKAETKLLITACTIWGINVNMRGSGSLAPGLIFVQGESLVQG